MGQGTDRAELGWKQGGKGREKRGEGRRDGAETREEGRALGYDFMLVRAVHILEKIKQLWHQGSLALILYIFCSYYLQFLIVVHATNGVCIRVDLLRYCLQHPVVTDAPGSSAPV